MKTSIIIDISPQITYLAKFWFSSYGLERCWPIELPDSLKYIISRKKWMMKFVFDMQRIEIFYKLILSFQVCVARHAQSAQNKKFTYLCNISRKTGGMKLFFCLQINTKVFCKVIVWLWICVTRLTQSNKFAISLQYLKENRKNEVDFLLAEKH